MKYQLPTINLQLIRSSVEADHMHTQPIPIPGQHTRSANPKARAQELGWEVATHQLTATPSSLTASIPQFFNPV